MLIGRETNCIIIGVIGIGKVKSRADGDSLKYENFVRFGTFRVDANYSWDS